MPWLRNEDAAMKNRLSGLTVQDANAPVGGREIGVRFRLPNDELANLTYPVIIIEHAGIYPDQERMQSGTMYQLPYAPENYPSWTSFGQPVNAPGSPYYTEYAPTPYNLDYQVTLYARFWSAHVQPTVATLAGITRLPAKHGAIWIPQDGTLRTMRLLGGPEEGYGLDEDSKRLFKVVYRVRVYTELVEYIETSVAFGGTLIPVNAVGLDFSVYQDPNPIDLTTPAGIAKNTGILSVGLPSTLQVLS